MNRPYPWRCDECGNKAVQQTVIEHRAQVKHENALHEVYVPDLPVHQCNHCKAVTVGEEADARIREALRKQLGLLSPTTIPTAGCIRATRREPASSPGLARLARKRACGKDLRGIARA